jgi:chitin synthase
MAAKVISTLYALVMMAVMVGLILQITDYGHLAPQSLMIFVVVGATVIAAILHPQEFWCLLAGLAFYVTIPSTYLLLVIYAIFNLNVVSWGTREVATKKSKMVRHFLWLSVSIVYFKIGLSGSQKKSSKRQFATANEFSILRN